MVDYSDSFILEQLRDVMEYTFEIEHELKQTNDCLNESKVKLEKEEKKLKGCY